MSSVVTEQILPPGRTGRHYHLTPVGSERSIPENCAPDGLFALADPHHPNTLLRASYHDTRFSPDTSRTDIFRYARWLPIAAPLPGAGGPVTYHAKNFGDRLGIRRLFVTFSGWWPEMGAAIPTGTFKENEAYAVYARMGDRASSQTLVVASAGNTARAFLRVATDLALPLVIVVPEDNVPALWTVGPRGPSTVVIAAGQGADYTDAIALAGLLTKAPGFVPEGGARNVARRDGMGTTFLSAAETIGAIPDHYIQAVGSGTGAIAAWEAALRLRAGGHPGATNGSTTSPGLPRLHLAQNAPFQLLVDSWNSRTRDVAPLDAETARRQITEIDAKVLANRTPPWGVGGGLFDALTDTDGLIYGIDNSEAHAEGSQFEEIEGIDITPAARVACGALARSVREGTIGPDDTVSLNITGGGFQRAIADLETQPLRPDLVVDPHKQTPESIAHAVAHILTRRS